MGIKKKSIIKKINERLDAQVLIYPKMEGGDPALYATIESQLETVLVLWAQYLETQEVSQRLCESMMAALTGWENSSHKYARGMVDYAYAQSYARGTDGIHAQMQALLPKGMNEGKCFPPGNPDCS